MTIKYNKKHGFTLMEIMACMIIISIVSSITLPAINNFRSSDRVKAEGQLLVSAIRNAKYSSLENNELMRIKFSNDGSSFREEVYESLGKPLINIETIIKNNRANDDSWNSIGDTEETDFTPEVEVDVHELLDYNYELYFLPDGYIYVLDNSSGTSKFGKITEVRVAFKYGSAALVVDINALGVISSEAFARNDDDDYDDEDKTEW